MMDVHLRVQLKQDSIVQMEVQIQKTLAKKFVEMGKIMQITNVMMGIQSTLMGVIKIAELKLGLPVLEALLLKLILAQKLVEMGEISNLLQINVTMETQRVVMGALLLV